nr:6559_t:CDS:10 [Entrophospora candida]
MGAANNNDTGSKDWLKERAAISAAHRRQKTDPAASKLVDQLHKDRIQGNAEETVDEEYEDLDAITSVPPPEEIVVKVAPKENTTTTLHGKETSEDVYQSFMKSVLEGGLATESSLELSNFIIVVTIKMLQAQGIFIFKLVSSWRIHELYSKKKDALTPNTVDIIGNIDNIIDFLKNFHNQLVKCNTASDCIFRFPKGESLLKDLAFNQLNRILILHPVACQLIVKCVLEFSKCLNNVPNFIQGNNSRNWCADRIKSIIQSHNDVDEISDNFSYYNEIGLYEFHGLIVKEFITTIKEFLKVIENSSVELPNKCFIKISQQCLPLLNDLNMVELIDRIIVVATKNYLNYETCLENNNNDEQFLLFSDVFIEKLIFINTTFYEHLSIDAKDGLWATCPITVENEIMNIFGQLLFPIDSNYMNPHYIKGFLKSNIIIQRMFKHPEIFHQCLYVLMKLILEIPDQRILRLIELVIQLIFDENIEFIVNKSNIKCKFLSKLIDMITILKSNPDLNSLEELNRIRKHSFTIEESSYYLNHKRQVWIIFKSCVKWNYWTINEILDINKYSNIEELKEFISYLGWLILPIDEEDKEGLINLIITLTDIIIRIRDYLLNSARDISLIIKLMSQHKNLFENNSLLLYLILGILKYSETNFIESLESIVSISNHN